MNVKYTPSLLVHECENCQKYWTTSWDKSTNSPEGLELWNSKKSGCSFYHCLDCVKKLDKNKWTKVNREAKEQ